jgi:urease beta subunit
MAEPAHYIVPDGDIELNAGRRTVTVRVRNTGDRPVQVGSHYHFFEANRALDLDRRAAYGMRLDIPAGTAVRFEPGDERDVTLVELGGARRAIGFAALVDGDLDDIEGALARARAGGFLGAGDATSPAEPGGGASSSKPSGEAASSEEL